MGSIVAIEAFGALGLMKTLEESDLERGHESELEGSERPLE